MAYVYIIKAEGIDRYKIGKSECPPRRISELKSMSPIDLSIVCIVDAKEKCSDLESSLHREFQEFLHHGEWFDLPDHKLKEAKRLIDFFQKGQTSIDNKFHYTSSQENTKSVLPTSKINRKIAAPFSSTNQPNNYRSFSDRKYKVFLKAANNMYLSIGKYHKMNLHKQTGISRDTIDKYLGIAFDSGALQKPESKAINISSQ